MLVGTRNPLNLGAAARAMSNFGALHMRVVNAYEPSFREARSAVGPATEVLAGAEVFDSLAAAVSDCHLIIGTTAIQQRELKQPVYRLDEAAGQIRQQLGIGRVAIVFGSEKTGLSNHALSYCHWLLHVPTRSEHRSMNLGQSVAVTLYELSRDVLLVSPTENRNGVSATSEDLERLADVLLDVLRLSGYTLPATLGATEEKVRRMVRRMGLNSRDAEVLVGMLRQIEWKLKE